MTKTVSLALVLFVALFSAGQAAIFEDAINKGAGGTFTLNGSTTYTGGVWIYRDTVIKGNGARISLASGQTISIGNNARVTFDNVRISGGSGILLNNAGASYFAGNRMTVENAAGSCINANAAKLTLTNCTFRNSKYGVHLYSGSIADRISSCTFSALSTGLMLTNSNALNVTGCTVTGCQSNGILSSGATKLLVDNTKFSNNRRSDGATYCVSLQKSSNVTIQNCLFTDSYRAIYTNSSTNVTIKNTVVAKCSNTDGISIQESSSATIDGCEVSGSLSGVSVTGNSVATIKNSYFHHNIKGPGPVYRGQGLYAMTGGKIIVRDTYILNNENEGIYCKDAVATIERCGIENNGWGAHDGNGINLTNTPGSIIDVKCYRNYLFGIQIDGHDATIRGCDVRANHFGGIHVNANAPGRRQSISTTIMDRNTTGDKQVYELVVSKSATDLTVSNCLISSNPNIGVLAQTDSLTDINGCVIYGNTGCNLNSYLADVLCENSVFAKSSSSIFLNGANYTAINGNDIVDSDKGADAMTCANSPNLTSNWWGSASGPYNQTSNSSGNGVSARNVTYKPWRTKPVSYYFVSRNVSLSKDNLKIFSAPTMPFGRLSIVPGSALTSQVLSVQCSSTNLFPHISLPTGLPSRVFCLWVNASHEIRGSAICSKLSLTTTNNYFLNLPKMKVMKYNYSTSKWDLCDTLYKGAYSTLEVNLKDPHGLYLLIDGDYAPAGA